MSNVGIIGTGSTAGIIGARAKAIVDITNLFDHDVHDRGSSPAGRVHRRRPCRARCSGKAVDSVGFSIGLSVRG